MGAVQYFIHEVTTNIYLKNALTSKVLSLVSANSKKALRSVESNKRQAGQPSSRYEICA